MVCFGFAARAGQGITTRAATHVFTGDRAQIREQAVAFALLGLLENDRRESRGIRSHHGVIASRGTASPRNAVPPHYHAARTVAQGGATAPR